LELVGICGEFLKNVFHDLFNKYQACLRGASSHFLYLP
jgi:hypothetical protein